MSRRQKPRHPEWRSEAGTFINHFIAPTKQGRYPARPELLIENISHDLERHLDSRRAIHIGKSVRTSDDLIGVLREVLGSVDESYLLVAGPYCPRSWRERHPVAMCDLVDDQRLWLSNVLVSFNRGAAGYVAAEESTNTTRMLLLANESLMARAASVLRP